MLPATPSPWGWGWDAVAAVGQAAGAIATAVAVIVALAQARHDRRKYLDEANERRKQEAKARHLRARAVKFDVGVTPIGYDRPGGQFEWTALVLHFQIDNTRSEHPIEKMSVLVGADPMEHPAWELINPALAAGEIKRHSFPARELPEPVTTSADIEPDWQPWGQLRFRDVDGFYWIASHLGDVELVPRLTLSPDPE